MLNIIVAYARNGVIGKNNDLPWYLPADLKRFKTLTTGHTVIMGRKTFDSIIARLKKPLPNRKNIVITSTPDINYPDVNFVNTPEEALSATAGQNEVFVIGGQRVFEAFLPTVERIYATEIQQDIEGDVYFPEFDKSLWQEVSREHFAADSDNPLPYDYATYERVATND